MRGLRRGVIAAGVTALVGTLITPAGATPMATGPGSLDPTFGSGGITTTVPTNSLAGEPAAVALQGDGSVVVAGGSGVPGTTAQGHVVVFRYRNNGILDTTFGSSGSVTTDFGGLDFATAVAVQSDGKIVVLGDSLHLSANPPTSDIVLARYSGAGVLDPTFGLAGKVSLHVSDVNEAQGLVLQPDGTIVIAGGAGPSLTSLAGSMTLLARYTPVGVLDSTFGTPVGAGMTTTKVGAGSTATGVVIQSDGTFLASGASSEGALLLRYTAGGALDTSFGNGGHTSVTLGVGDAVGLALTLQGDKKVVMAGGNTHDLAVIRFNADGSLDPTFGLNGRVTGAFLGTDLLATGVVVQGDGKIVISGMGAGLFATRLNSDGTTDRSFGTDGRSVVLEVDTASEAILPRTTTGLAQQPDGNLILAGTSQTFPLTSGVTRSSGVARSSGAPRFLGSALASGATPPVRRTPAAGVTRAATATRAAAAAPPMQLYAARLLGGSGPASAVPNTATRLAGDDRVATAIAISTSTFSPAGSFPGADQTPANEVVLASGDNFPDALVGTPLAADRGGPLLLTRGPTLDPRVKAEIDRLLGGGGSGATVNILGGSSAIGDGVAGTLAGAGYNVVRFAGTDRFDTALQVAAALTNVTTVVEATGRNFADALSGGAAAAYVHGAVLLTDDSTMPPSVRAYLDAHPGDLRIAIGGPAAGADPRAEALSGTDRYDTSAKVASRFFLTPSEVGVASGLGFADALSGGAQAAAFGAPLLLTDPANLSPTVSDYLTSRAPFINRAFVYGGPAAISDPVVSAVQLAIT